MVELQREANLRVRDHAFVQKQVVGGDLAAVPDDPLDLFSADGAQTANTAPHRNACPAQRKQPAQPFRKGMAARPDAAEVAERGMVVFVRCRLEERRRRRAGACQLQRSEIKEGALAREHDAPVRHEVGSLQQDLRRAHRHDAGQYPARDRHRPLDRAGREQDAPGIDRVACAIACQGQHAVRVDMPDRRRRAVAGAARPQRRDEGLTR